MKKFTALHRGEKETRCYNSATGGESAFHPVTGVKLWDRKGGVDATPDEVRFATWNQTRQESPAACKRLWDKMSEDEKTAAIS